MTCAVCRRATCEHSDLAYAGLVSPASPSLVAPADDATTPRVGHPINLNISHFHDAEVSDV